MPSRAVARSTDPETSWEAARSFDPETLRQSQRVVLGALQAYGPMTDEDLVTRVHDLSPSGTRTRRAELVDRGLVYDTGQRVLSATRRRMIVWAARVPDPSRPTLWGSL